jgi:hypothetical protein
VALSLGGEVVVWVNWEQRINKEEQETNEIDGKKG